MQVLGTIEVKHSGPLQTNAYSEQFCVEDDGSTYSLSTLYSYIGNTLYNDNTSQDWDELGLESGYYNLYWYSAGPTECTSHPYRSDIEVEYSVSPSGCGGGFSCADHDAYDSTWDGHQLFWYGYVGLHDDHLSPLSLRRHVINHETGHVLGLADPDMPDIGDFNNYPDEAATLCGDFYSITNGEDSVMHSDHYCS